MLESATSELNFPESQLGLWVVPVGERKASHDAENSLSWCPCEDR